MKIGIDGGALCAAKKDFLGTSIFSENLINALYKYDKKNIYKTFTFCDLPRLNQTKKLPKKGFMKIGITSQELVSPSDIFLGLNQALPLRTKAKIISFCHGLSYAKFPELYKNSFNKFIGQLDTMTRRSDTIIVSSSQVKQELKKLKKNLKVPVEVILFGVPFDFQKTVKRKKQKFFLFVGSHRPIKNVEYLVSSFQEIIKADRYSEFELYLVGQHQKYAKFKNIKVLPNLNRGNLKKLYQEAACYLSASHYESFNFPVLEALSQNCPVIATKSAVIPEMKKYVNVAKNRQDFLKLMKKAAEGKMRYNYSQEVNTVFNWRDYVIKLNQIYETVSHSTHPQRRR